MIKRLIILRGCPGSFKSTYANRIKTKLHNIFGLNCIICSADDYFIKNGVYNYDRSKAGRAHEQCYENANRAMRDGVDIVLLDNTNITRNDFKHYVKLAEWFKYAVIEKVFGLNESVDVLFNRNIHGVPKEKIEIMLVKLRNSIKDRDERWNK